jgi:hypothetical protein
MLVAETNIIVLGAASVCLTLVATTLAHGIILIEIPRIAKGLTLLNGMIGLDARGAPVEANQRMQEVMEAIHSHLQSAMKWTKERRCIELVLHQDQILLIEMKIHINLTIYHHLRVGQTMQILIIVITTIRRSLAHHMSGAAFHSHLDKTSRQTVHNATRPLYSTTTIPSLN